MTKLIYMCWVQNWAQQILQRDAQRTKQDSLDEIWAMQLPPLPVLGGTVQGQLYDLHRCFNLNNLVQTDGTINESQQLYFERLLQLLDLPVILSQQIIDWIDKNKKITLPNGAENNVYLAQPKAYRTANQAFIDPSELRLLQAMNDKDYQTLSSYICTLPTPSRINVNTAPLELLLSLNQALRADDIQTLIEQREQHAFESVQSFLQHDALAGLEIDAQLLTTQSEYFSFIGKAEIGEGRAYIQSLLQRKNNKIRVLIRHATPF